MSLTFVEATITVMSRTANILHGNIIILHFQKYNRCFQNIAQRRAAKQEKTLQVCGHVLKNTKLDSHRVIAKVPSIYWCRITPKVVVISTRLTHSVTEIKDDTSLIIPKMWLSPDFQPSQTRSLNIWKTQQEKNAAEEGTLLRAEKHNGNLNKKLVAAVDWSERGCNPITMRLLICTTSSQVTARGKTTMKNDPQLAKSHAASVSSGCAFMEERGESLKKFILRNTVLKTCTDSGGIWDL